MRNRKSFKLNIILLVALAIAGIIFFVMFEDKEETSIVGATKVYDTWIGFDSESTNHKADHSLAAESSWLCCEHGARLTGWSESLNMSASIIDSSKFTSRILELINCGDHYETAWREFPNLDEWDIQITRPSDMPNILLEHLSFWKEGTSDAEYGFTESEYKFYTFGDYSSYDSKSATPMEAYILSHISENSGEYSSSVQQAWWATSAGGGSRSTVKKEKEWHLQLEHLRIML